jgi:nitronate monooxygenase
VAVQQAGADIVIAQGREAGGHVRGRTPLRELLPAVVDALEVPVLAAGGLATGGDLLTALALGADGIVLGTALLAAEESFAHAEHKQRIIAASGRDTVLTEAFHINWPPAAPVRVLASDVTRGRRIVDAPQGRIVIGEDQGRPIYLFSTDSPLRTTTGELDAMALYAGTGVGHVRQIRPAADIVDELIEEAQVDPVGLEAASQAAVELSSPVCYIGEVRGAYAGQLDTAEIAAEIALVMDELRALLRVSLRGAQGSPAADGDPPFVASAVPLARWIVSLAAAWTWRPARGPRDGDVAALLDHLGRLIPQLPDNDLREGLAALRRALQTGERVPVPAAPTEELAAG